ncbi:MAG: ParB/RepB/Spo0J family partition protein [Planctomycetes bacterium]|nr:ParB/RepB/Spo0J family partition protein [Planctomycetota bacterium]MBI3848275.1 ParB/RepB/Spo0J family partition protein [Planctomycetota bacterium]
MAEKRLGRGLDFLISEDSSFNGDEVLEVDIKEVRANPRQPRTRFDDQTLRELADSIKEQGLLQPILLRPVSNGYEVVAGERRLRACQLLGLDTVRAIVRTISDSQLLELALVENLQRQDLNPIEKATACKRLIDESGLTQADAAKRLGKDRSTLANLLRLLELPTEIQELISAGAILTGHAKVLLSMPDPKVRIAAAKRIVLEDLSVRAVENIARLATTPSPGSSVAKKPATLTDLEERLQLRLGTRVSIHEGKRRGFIRIEFTSPKDFERVFAQLMGESR